MNEYLRPKWYANSQFIALSVLCSAVLSWGIFYCPCQAAPNWETIDRQLKNQIFQLNVGLKLRLKNKLWVQVADMSASKHYYVFSTGNNDPGYQVVAHGSSFPVAIDSKEKKIFLTSRHVLDNASQLSEESQMFFAALRLYASRTAGKTDIETHCQQLFKIINLSQKKDLNLAENKLYQNTVDAVWDCYDHYLSKRADPARLLFNRYCKLFPIQTEIGYFLHAPALVAQPPIIATIYKKGSTAEQDLAILTANHITVSACMQLDSVLPGEGEEIQVVGYPEAAELIDLERTKCYAPFFINGTIVRAMPHSFQFNALISKGNSGGPVISSRGKVLGVVTLKALSSSEKEQSNYGTAINVQAIKNFAPELFKSRHN